MKTSKKILVTITFILIGFWIYTLFVVRKDMRSIMASKPSIAYKTVAIDKFTKLDFSSNWIVRIKQGKDCKVEVEVVKQDGLKPQLEMINGTLYLKSQAKTHARITLPSIHEIKAAGDTRIQMKNFWSDSLTVILADSSTFAGHQNDFDNIRFKTSGQSR